MEKKNFITILGLGNILLSDEGFGVHFIRWFSERYRLPDTVEAIDGGTLGYSLLDPIGNCKHLIVVDVIKLQDTPGSLYRFTREALELHMPPPTSAHEVVFLDVIYKAELIEEAPEDVIFLCIVPEEYGDTCLEMTETMWKKFPDMEEMLLKELSLHGIVPERIGHA
ncbi:MAG TPA: HyaD/HybD family hydrogenase maturation endopeptidase [Syntrophales bacterium]|nr:HyaD/HybD family hydrogenase maturation endopeptidase [Syntrophales bacterium]HPQ43018.1 HyaD/HybD family hydrogenase maturation endopeptidase [Syntrophales bacterium]